MMGKVIIAALLMAALWYFQDRVKEWVGINLVDIVGALVVYSVWSNYALAKHVERLQGIVDQMQGLE